MNRNLGKPSYRRNGETVWNFRQQNKNTPRRKAGNAWYQRITQGQNKFLSHTLSTDGMLTSVFRLEKPIVLKKSTELPPNVKVVDRQTISITSPSLLWNICMGQIAREVLVAYPLYGKATQLRVDLVEKKVHLATVKTFVLGEFVDGLPNMTILARDGNFATSVAKIYYAQLSHTPLEQ